MDHQETITHRRLRSLILTALFAALTAVGAFIRVPTPLISFTLQTFFVVLAALLLGPKYGALSQVIYVAVGLIGLPVFTKGGGPQYVFEPSFGYLAAFVIAAAVMGVLVRRGQQSFWRLLGVSAIGLAIIYIIGSVYMCLIMNYYIGTAMSIWRAFWVGSIIFIPTDMLMSAGAVFVALRLYRLLPEARAHS